MEKHIKTRLIKNLLLSVLIYALPVILMFVTFYFNGQKPWLKKQAEKTAAAKAIKQ